jgi:hypothetical protein
LRDYRPIKGKTYSLFGQDASTEHFYRKIPALTDDILGRFALSQEEALEYIQQLSRNKRKLRKSAGNPSKDAALAMLLQQMDDNLSNYLTGVEQHLRSAPPHKIITDRRLLTSRQQYYLYMIEFELVNRIHKERFLDSNFRIALLPYCLRETQTDCKARPDEIDYVCRGCLKTCYINEVSKLLREHDVHPYIWRNAKLKSLFRELIGKHGSIGVLGIACVVELVWGMRLCMKVKLPVMGIPLNANRCARWMDGFYENSIDLSPLEMILND